MSYGATSADFAIISEKHIKRKAQEPAPQHEETDTQLDGNREADGDDDERNAFAHTGEPLQFGHAPQSHKIGSWIGNRIEFPLGQLDFWRALLGEFIGTFFLIFIGVGAVITSGIQQYDRGDVRLIVIVLTFCAVLIPLVSSFAQISGAHFNPAVTIAFFITRQTGLIRAVFYVCIQLVAAAFASLLHKLFVAEASSLQLGMTILGDGVEPWEGVIIEALITFLLLWVIFCTAIDQVSIRDDTEVKLQRRAITPFAVAFAIGANSFFAAPLSGSSMNPARSFGPALLAWNWTNQWVYWFGPILGACVSALAYQFLFLFKRNSQPIRTF